MPHAGRAIRTRREAIETARTASARPLFSARHVMCAAPGDPVADGRIRPLRGEIPNGDPGLRMLRKTEGSSIRLENTSSTRSKRDRTRELSRGQTGSFHEMKCKELTVGGGGSTSRPRAKPRGFTRGRVDRFGRWEARTPSTCAIGNDPSASIFNFLRD